MWAMKMNLQDNPWPSMVNTETAPVMVEDPQEVIEDLHLTFPHLHVLHRRPRIRKEVADQLEKGASREPLQGPQASPLLLMVRLAPLLVPHKPMENHLPQECLVILLQHLDFVLLELKGFPWDIPIKMACHPVFQEPFPQDHHCLELIPDYQEFSRLMGCQMESRKDKAKEALKVHTPIMLELTNRYNQCHSLRML
jgi:hypothetical protein